MGKFITILALLVALFGMLPRTALAAPADPRGVYTAIATCLGRYSAELEHSHLIGSGARVAETGHRNFRDLYSMIEADRRFLALRISAKSQHARLLSTATFGTDQRRARLAAAQAARQITACNELLLG